jgi:hypothetical protein
VRICTDRRAAEAKQSAPRSKNPWIKSAFEEAATGWLVFAEQMESIDRERQTKTGPDGPSGTQLYIAHRDPTAWLGIRDSNSETSAQIIPLKDRTDLRESNRMLLPRLFAFELRCWGDAARAGKRL